MNPIKLSLCLAFLAACASADTRSHAHGGFVGHAGPSLGATHGHGGSFVSGHGASHGGSFGRGVGGHGGSVVVGHSVSSGPVYGGCPWRLLQRRTSSQHWTRRFKRQHPRQLLRQPRRAWRLVLTPTRSLTPTRRLTPTCRLTPTL
ncbi:uncharacterized protein LOC134771470 [Penaeus indicus]|uniref:uncharacterized protein LOC134771470 n=1 Tax=Penaeus indicus TaxID=29960 RepID=UPI00300C7D3F